MGLEPAKFKEGDTVFFASRVDALGNPIIFRGKVDKVRAQKAGWKYYCDLEGLGGRALKGDRLFGTEEEARAFLTQ